MTIHARPSWPSRASVLANVALLQYREERVQPSGQWVRRRDDREAPGVRPAWEDKCAGEGRAWVGNYESKTFALTPAASLRRC